MTDSTDQAPAPPRTEAAIFDDLTALCASSGYAHALADLCFRDVVVGYGAELKAEDLHRLFAHDRLIRTEITTLVGLMTRGAMDLALPTPAQLQEYVVRTDALLKELHMTMMQPMMAGMQAVLAGESGDADADPFTTAAAMREPIFYGAESAFSFQFLDLSREKYARDQEWLRSEKGFTPAEARQFAVAVADLLNGKLWAELNRLRTVPPDMWTLLDGFRFTAEEVSKYSGLDPRLVTIVADAYSSGEAGNPSFTALHEFNAARAYPIVRDGNAGYLLFHETSLAEALYDTPFYWMGADTEYVSTAMGHRGLFAEEFTAACLEQVFGSQNVYRNVDIWESEKKRKKLGEIDVLVLFGGRGIVVQAKSKRLTLIAQQGNDLQLRADFKGAVQDACDQAVLCARELLKSSAYFTDAAGKPLAINPVRRVHPICVVSDHYPALSFQAHQFLKFAAPNAVEWPLVCDVFLVDVITEFLKTPLRCLSYLELRARAGDKLLLSHEITALGFHLKRNLWLSDEYDMVTLEDGLAADIEVAMAVRRLGIPGEKTPPGILTHMQGTSLGRIIQQIETNADPAAVEIGLELLKFSGETVGDVSLAIDRLVELGADGGQHDATFAMGKDGSGITIHCNRLPVDQALPKLQQHCELRKYSQKAQKWMGLSIDADDTSLRFGGVVDFPWRREPGLDRAVARMPKPKPIAEARKVLRSKAPPKRKIGRNEPCPCGSGLKYKKCHLQKGGWR